MSDVLDLDALAPKPVTVHFGNEDIEIEPPTTSSILRLGSLGKKIESADQLSDDEMEKLVDDMTNQIYKCIPALGGKKLNTAQLLKLVEIISKMSLPPDAEELQKRGITAETAKKAQ